MIGLFLQSLLVGFSGAIVPGSLFAVTLSQSLSVGWTAGIWLTSGHVIAELLLLFALRAGLGKVLQRPRATQIIGLVGGAVLLYFAWGMMTVSLAPQTSHVVTSAHLTPLVCARLIALGFVLTLTNPYWYLWWATAGVGMIGMQVVKHGARAWPVFFVGHGFSDYIWYLAVSTAIALTGAFMSPSIHRVILVTAGVGVAALGIMFIYRQCTAWMHVPRNLSAGD